ncbi:hypothetical protein METP2_02421 [Methanosarcinales archaeon]|nr:hypothetical protein METP2_02421 [Methanosarcinales archaeon]
MNMTLKLKLANLRKKQKTFVNKATQSILTNTIKDMPDGN